MSKRVRVRPEPKTKSPRTRLPHRAFQPEIGGVDLDNPPTDMTGILPVAGFRRSTWCGRFYGEQWASCRGCGGVR